MRRTEPAAPTSALARAAGFTVVLLLLAVTVRRLDLLILAGPFLVATVRGLLHRRDAVTLTAGPSAVVLREGDGVDVTGGGPAGWTTVVAVPGSAQASTDPTWGAAADVTSCRVRLAPQRWGQHLFEGPTVQAEDPSHSWRARIQGPSLRTTVEPTAQVMVGPSGITDPLGVQGVHRSVVAGEGTDLAEVRSFRPGDRLRRINWRVTQRTGQLHINSTLTERDTTILVVLDTTGEVTGAEGSGAEGPAGTRDEPIAESSLDLAVRATSAISRHYLAAGDRVGLHDLGRRTRAVPSGTGPRQRRIISEALARTRRDDRPISMIDPAPPVRPGTLVFVCTTLLDEDVVAQVVHLARAGAQVVVIDTLPAVVGDLAHLPSRRVDSRSRRPVPEAWVLRRLQREPVVAGLERMGVPVVAWAGPASLAAVLERLERARRAPRLARR
ncbi:DUF58 domain-containing protein [Acidipropionibacterium timonense]|uniref:DUF58 domain-containing protein n=1 Tax=Acidipropionibacterium timonense TaxID=2161818 RepID=UPI00102F773F|nr:DUF58 domain-containing protein [Acidipropionibacterium timonense]